MFDPYVLWMHGTLPVLVLTAVSAYAWVFEMGRRLGGMVTMTQASHDGADGVIRLQRHRSLLLDQAALLVRLIVIDEFVVFSVPLLVWTVGSPTESLNLMLIS